MTAQHTPPTEEIKMQEQFTLKQPATPVWKTALECIDIINDLRLYGYSSSIYLLSATTDESTDFSWMINFNLWKDIAFDKRIYDVGEDPSPMLKRHITIKNPRSCDDLDKLFWELSGMLHSAKGGDNEARF